MQFARSALQRGSAKCIYIHLHKYWVLITTEIYERNLAHSRPVLLERWYLVVGTFNLRILGPVCCRANVQWLNFGVTSFLLTSDGGFHATEYKLTRQNITNRCAEAAWENMCSPPTHIINTNATTTTMTTTTTSTTTTTYYHHHYHSMRRKQKGPLPVSMCL